MKHYDLIIIGGGTGGFAAAMRANELQAKTLLINNNELVPLGGTCLNVGCVPSKALIHAAEVLHQSGHHNIPGIELNAHKVDFGAVVTDVTNLVDQMREEKYSKPLEGFEYVTFVNGQGAFVATNEIRVNDLHVSADKIIIATGSTASASSIEGLTEVGYLTHVEALQQKHVPKQLIVIGAGPIGLELAQFYTRFGSKVTILQRNQSIYPPAEKELTDHLKKLLEKEGIIIKTGVEIVKTIRRDGLKEVTYTENGVTATVAGQDILLAAGKTANTAELNLEAADVQVNDKKQIITKPTLTTSKPHIFALGDVTDLPLRLEMTAADEGLIAVENALNDSHKNIDYNFVPYTIFTDPQLAGVGYTEERLLAEFGTADCRVISFNDLPKGPITKQTDGLIKMVIHPQTRIIMGVQALAPGANDLITQAMILMRNKNTIDDVTEMAFPTLSEALKFTALSFTRDISKICCL